MKHKQFEEWLQLSLYNELSEQEQTVLDNHLKTCERCRADLKELKKIHVALAHRQTVAIKKPLLQDARRSLRLRIQADSEQKSLWTEIEGHVRWISCSTVSSCIGWSRNTRNRNPCWLFNFQIAFRK